MTMTRVGLLVLAVLLSATPAWAQREAIEFRSMDAANECVILGVAGHGTGAIQVTRTYVGTVTWTVSVDGSTYVAADAFTPADPGTAVNSTTSTGVWTVPVAGLRSLKACMTAYTSGTADVTLSAVGTGGGGGGGGSAGGGLTDAELRATPVPVSGTVTANLSGTDNGVLDAIAASVAAGATAALQADIITAIEAIPGYAGVADGSTFSAADIVAMAGVVRRDSASAGTGVINGERGTISVDAFGSVRTMLASGADGAALAFATDPTHDGAGGTSGPQNMLWAVDFAATPANVTAADAVHALATRAGIPFTSPGHPNMIAVEAQVQDADNGQTDTPIVTVSAGTRVVVTGVAAHCDGSTTAPTNVAIGFGTANVPAGAHTGTAGVLARFDGIPAGGGFVKGFNGGIIGVGADNEDVRYTMEDPAGGNCSVEVSYYTIATAA